MSNIKGYTKGPWEIWESIPDGDGYRSIHAGPVIVARLKAPVPFCHEDHANAHLVAAAPETYERCLALEEVLAEFLAWANIGDKSPSVGLRDKAKKLLEEK